MRRSGNTIFIAGGTSGIGRGLAEAFHERGNQVIITGRREERLRELCGAHPGMRYYPLDVTDARAIRTVAAKAVDEFPALDCMLNNAGIQLRIDFAPGRPSREADLHGHEPMEGAVMILVTAAYGRTGRHIIAALVAGNPPRARSGALAGEPPGSPGPLGELECATLVVGRRPGAYAQYVRRRMAHERSS